MQVAPTMSRTIAARALSGLQALPPFRPVLNRLLSTLSNDGVHISRVAEIVESDPVIAATLLSHINSAFYGRRGTVDSVRTAVSLLGINKVRNAIFALSMSHLWRNIRLPDGWSIADFNLHSVACGVLSDAISKRCHPAYPVGAFVAGLLHDVGSLLIVVALPEENETIRRMQEGGWTRMDAERNVIGVTHADLSALALEKWNLPEPIQRAVRYHHSPNFDTSPVRRGEVTLSRVLNCADEYVQLIHSEPGDGRPDQSFRADHFAPLGIEDVESMLDDFYTELAVMTEAVSLAA